MTSGKSPLPTQKAVSVVDPGSDEERELRTIWISQRMFGWMVGHPEHRDYEDWLEGLGMRLG